MGELTEKKLKFEKLSKRLKHSYIYLLFWEFSPTLPKLRWGSDDNVAIKCGFKMGYTRL